MKKLLSLLLTIAMVFTITPVFAYSDVEANTEAITILSDLGIIEGYEDGTFKPEEIVTRAEMTKLIAETLGYSDIPTATAATEYTDVPANHWASGYINMMSKLGAIEGHGDGTFDPEGEVTFEQATKMIMSTLGYKPFADKNGGYPTGYLAAASQKDVLDGVNGSIGIGMTRGNVAQMLANAIDTPLMAISKWNSNGEVEYEIFDGNGNEYKTIMSEYLKVIKVAGIVTATNYVGRTFDTENDLEFDLNITKYYGNIPNDFGTKFYGEISNDFFGKKAIAYFTKDNSTNKYNVISIVEDSNINEVLEITLDSFKGINGNIFTYYKNNDTVDVKLDSNCVVYNNYVSGTISANEKASGKVTLINNDNNTGYDYIIVEEAETYVVDEVRKDRIETKTHNDFDIDAEDTDVKMVLIKNGEEINFTELNEWDVISFVGNPEKGYSVGEVIAAPVEGSVTATYSSATSANGTGIKISGVKYDIATGAYNLLDDDDKLAIEIGDSGSFYIDAYGKVAAYNEDDTVKGVAGHYGFVMGSADETLFDTVTKVQMITETGVKVFELTSNVKIYDETYNETTIDKTYVKVVKYSLNSAGKINRIYLASTNARLEEKYYNKTGVTSTFDADINRLGSYYVDEDAIVFFVNKMNINDIDADKCYYGSVADLEHETDYTVCAVYADRKAEDNNIIVVKNDINTIGSTSSLAVITEVSHGYNEYDEAVQYITYLINGEEHKGETIANINEVVTIGDIVKIKTNGTIIRNITKIWSTNLIDDLAVISGIENTALNEKFVIKNSINITEYNEDREIVDNYKLLKAYNIYVIDKTGRNIIIETGSMGDFVWEDRADYLTDEKCTQDSIAFREYDGRVTDVIIVKSVEERVTGTKVIEE